MKLMCLFLFGSLASVLSATTINTANHFAYGANTGWQDWRGDTANGAVIGIGCVKFGGNNDITSPFLGTVSP